MCLSGAHYSIDDYEDRIIEMAWEDRTPFEAIEYQYGMKENDVRKLMRENLTRKSFELWRKSENRVELLEVKDWTEGNNVYAENGIAVAGNITTLVEGLGYELYPNVPNPFSSLTSVSFFAPKSGEVVIGVYDMLGNLVIELTNATYDAGMY